MAKIVQMDAAVHGILNVSARANVPQREVPTQFRPASMFPRHIAFRREKTCASKRSPYDHCKEMRTPGMQLYACARKESLQRYMCRCEENARADLPMQAPGVHRGCWPQDVVSLTHVAIVGLEFLFDVQPISTVKGQCALHDPTCNIRNNSRSACIGRAVHQHSSLSGGGHGAEGRLRPSRLAHGLGVHGVCALGSFAQVQPARSRLAGSGSIRFVGGTWVRVVVCAATCHGLRLASGGTQAVSPVGQPHAGTSGIRQDSGRRSDHRAIGARPHQRSRYGHCGSGACSTIQSARSPDREPPHLRSSQRWRP